MAESSNPEAGKRFASDLRLIRESRGITAQTLHDETKIPMGLIESFEQTGLFDHPMFNRVYLRSFVRTYTQVVGISQERALASLDEALEGTYQGSLARAYLGDVGTQPETSTEAISDEETSAAPEVETYPVAGEQEGRPRESTAPPDEAIANAPPAPATGFDESAGHQQVKTPEPLPRYSSHTSTDRPSASTPRRMAVERENEERAGKGWIYVLTGVVAAALIGFFFFNSLGTSDDNAVDAISANENTSPASMAEDTVSAPASISSPLVLGDTMAVTITAANAPVQNIKVTVDDDLRRPYWIELGESRTFLPTDRIIIERQLPKIELHVEGRPYPTNRTDDQGRIVITRDSAQQILGGRQ